jgi:hypothetical protein
MTVANLGFKIDSSPASSAALDLDKLTAAASRTQMAADKLEAEVASLGASLGKSGQGARGAQAPVDALGRSFGTQDDHVRSFRMEIERLTLKYQPLAQATRAYETSVGEINRAHQLGVINAQQMQRALEGERQAFERLRSSANGASQAVTAANQNRGGAQGFNAANAGYQFQDIAVTAAMGMNPLMIGLQQGTQLASVVSSMEKPVAGLATAFASLLSPVSLITIGLTAGTAALVQYFMSGSEGSDGMSDDLREQIDLIAKVAERWGDATPRLKEYADEAVRMAEANERLAAGNALAASEFEKVEDVLGTINAEYTAAIRSLRGYGEDAAPIIRGLTTSFTELQTKILEGKATTDDLTAVQNAMAAALEGGATPAVQKLLEVFTDLVPKIQAATDAAAEFRKEGSGSIWPELGTLPGLFSDGGRMFSPNDFIPRNAPVPSRRPLIELEGDGSRPGAPTIINSDGRLTAVPVPGQRPNYFERESDLDFGSSKANKNTYWGRDVLQEEMRRLEMGTLFKGFFTDFGQSLRDNSGNLGKALMEGLSNSVMNAASAAWEKVANMAANYMLNALMGPPSAGLMNKSIGFTGANTTLGAVLGAGAGVPANNNVAGGFSGLSVGSVTRAPLGDISSYAEAIKSIESRGSGGYSALGPVTRNGDRAYGAYQVMGNNIGPWSKEALGQSISAQEFLKNPGLQDKIFESKFGGYVDKYGPSGAAQAWFGGPGSVGKGGGASDMLGTTGSAYVDKFNDALGSATDNLGGFGSGLGKVAETFSTSAFPAAPAAVGGGGGGGGIFSWLGGLFGGGGGKPSLAKYLPLTGLFADGTNYAPGGMAVVGERGPELVNLPGGSQVFDTNRSARMVGVNEGRGNQRPQLNVVVQGGSGDDHVRELARQGAQEAIFQYNQNQTRGGVLDTQQKATARKG